MANQTSGEENEDIIEISREDLESEPEAELPREDQTEFGPVDGFAPAGEPDLLVIELEDLAEVPRELPAVSPAQYPAVGERPTYEGLGKKPFAGGLIGSAVLQMALAGLIGGFLAWAIEEPFIHDEMSTGQSVVSVLLEMAGFGAVLGGMIGLALGSVEGLVSGVWEKAAVGGGLGLLIGGVGGAFGGLVGQIVYSILGGGSQVGGLGAIILQIGVRALAWGVVGVFVGLGQGVMMRAPQKIINGLIGGAVGGFIGGLLFDPISVVLASGLLSRMVGMSVMGLCAGAAIGMVEQIRKEAWLTIVAGPLTGKQFIIYRSPTIIGSSPKAEICLAKDPHIAPEHARIDRAGNRYLLSDLSGGQTAVNNRSVTQHQLRDGDYIAVGGTVLEYATRVVQEPEG